MKAEPILIRYGIKHSSFILSPLLLGKRMAAFGFSIGATKKREPKTAEKRESVQAESAKGD
jgi:hypothetical protein